MPNNGDPGVDLERGRGLPSGGTAHVLPSVQPETLEALDGLTKAARIALEISRLHKPIILERKDRSDEITFAGLTAGLGRRGTNRQA